jgi:hypothetical protein
LIEARFNGFLHPPLRIVAGDNDRHDGLSSF